MLNVTKKLKLFVLYTEVLSMIWLRLFIAVIALTISSDLSAWAQPQMQVNSPEGFYDCNGVANGTNKRDPVNDCCLPSQQTEDPCFQCIYKPNFCDKQTGVCKTTKTADRNNRCCDAHPFPCNDCNRPSMTFCETQLNQCNTTATQDKNNTCCNAHPSPCNDCNRPSMTSCELQLNKCGATPDVGCGCDKPAKVPRPPVGCPTTRCRANSNTWPMMHSHYSGCPSNYPGNAGHVNFGHGQTFLHVTLSANTKNTVACYGRTAPATCSDPGKSGFIYSTNLAGELITDAEAGSAQWRICDNGVIKAGTTLSPPVMYCP